MANELHRKLVQALSDRRTWEERQRGFYQMTMEGLRRRRSATWQADMFWPLINEAISKLVPFYYNQIFAQERLANFAAQRAQTETDSEAAAEYFDLSLKQDAELDNSSEFELEWLLAIWLMLLYGRGVVKVYWDPQKRRVRHCAIHPVFLIVPRCERLSEADYFAHVRTLSLGQYQRDPRLEKDPAVLKDIQGDAENSGKGNGLEEDQFAREGITHSRDKSQVIVWEAYERTPSGYLVHTFSPQAPEKPLRPPFSLPDRWRGEVFQPFVAFSMEQIEGGWYAPRGVAARLAPFQAYLCKLWNEKTDAMTLFNRPLFTMPPGTMPSNQANIGWTPGEIIPNGLSAVTMPQPPISFDTEMATTRQLAAEVITMPDAGVQGLLPETGSGQGRMTATEVDYRRALASTGVDLRGRMFRLALGQAYRKSWALMLSHRPEELAYYVAGQRKVLPVQALHDAYTIEPAGSPDYWHKSLRVQRAVTRLQMLNGNPFVRQEELAKDLLTAESPDLVKRLWMPQGMKQAEESEQEAIRIEALLMKGYRAAIRPDEDHETRLRVCFQKLQALATLGQPVDPMAKQRVMEAIATHLDFLKQQNPEAAAAIQKAGAVLDEAPPAGQPLPLPGAAPAGQLPAAPAPPELNPIAP